jgi:hypothetical protein
MQKAVEFPLEYIFSLLVKNGSQDRTCLHEKAIAGRTLQRYLTYDTAKQILIPIQLTLILANNIFRIPFYTVIMPYNFSLR